MHPKTIEYQMIGWSVKVDEIVDGSRGCGSRYFQTKQSVVVGPRSECDRSGALAIKFNLGQDVCGGSAIPFRSAGQRRHAGIAGGQASAFWRQTGIGSTGTDDDPVRVVAAF